MISDQEQSTITSSNTSTDVILRNDSTSKQSLLPPPSDTKNDGVINTRDRTKEGKDQASVSNQDFQNNNYHNMNIHPEEQQASTSSQNNDTNDTYIEQYDNHKTTNIQQDNIAYSTDINKNINIENEQLLQALQEAITNDAATKLSKSKNGNYHDDKKCVQEELQKSLDSAIKILDSKNTSPEERNYMKESLRDYINQEGIKNDVVAKTRQKRVEAIKSKEAAKISELNDDQTQYMSNLFQDRRGREQNGLLVDLLARALSFFM